MLAPIGVINLYRQAQVDADMDNGTYVGGTDRYGVDDIIEEIAELAGWKLPPRMNFEQRKQFLIDNDQEEYIEYLGVMGTD